MAKKSARVGARKKKKTLVVGLGRKRRIQRKKRIVIGMGMTKRKSNAKRRKGKKGGHHRGQIKVSTKQLSGLAPMNQLDLYRSQLATGIPA